MHNRVGFNKLSRKASHRNAMIKNMVTSLLRYERISTTKAKALEVRKFAEKMITRAKIDSVHNRRIVNKDLKDAEILNKLFTEIGPVNKDRPGGYTRILKTGLRKGDAAEMVILELVLDKEESKKKTKKKEKAAKPEPKKAATAEVAEKETAEAPVIEADAPAEAAEAPAEAAEEVAAEEVAAEEDK